VIDLDGPTPIYLQIADAIAQRIRDGVYQPNRRVPSATALAAEFGVSRRTAVEALRELRGRGLVIGVRGRGTFVAPPTDPEDTEDPEDPEDPGV